jgi:hypothetical protein
VIDRTGDIVLWDVVITEDVADLGELANHLLEPELESLVDDDEVHLVGVDATILSL